MIQHEQETCRTPGRKNPVAKLKAMSNFASLGRQMSRRYEFGQHRHRH